MKAPDKIYVEVRHPFGNEFTEMLGFESRGNSDDIEYIRKDSLWKPSDEQMMALNKVVNGEVLLTTQHKSLESLYEDLQKLM